MKKEHAQSLFEMAGFEVLSMHQLPNGYWPDCAEYADIRRGSPWWLAVTQHGPITIGWRKRVISIHWEDTKIRGRVTTDLVYAGGCEVTTGDNFTHAYGYAKALEYLTALAAIPIEVQRAAAIAARDAAREPA